MEKEIVRTLLVVSTGSTLSLFSVLPGPASPVQARTGATVGNNDSLLTRVPYKLRVADEERFENHEDTLSWQIRSLSEGTKEFFLNNTIKEYNFEDTGHFVVTAYRDMVEIARDTLIVVEGEKFDMRWPDFLTDTVGATFRFTDYSLQAEVTEWRIIGPDSLPVTSNEPDFAWTPSIPGRYQAELLVKFHSGHEERRSEDITVVTPEPVVVERTPVAPVPHRPRPKPAPRKPREPAPETVVVNACFGMQKTRLTRDLKVVIDEPASRQELSYESTPVSFLVTPKVDCALSSFTYFTKAAGSKVKISIKCTKPPPGYQGELETSRSYIGGFDAYQATFHELATMPVLFAGLEYKVTITPVTGEMGYFPTGTNKFKEVDENGRPRMNGTGIRFTDAEKTCLFNVYFKCGE